MGISFWKVHINQTQKWKKIYKYIEIVFPPVWTILASAPGRPHYHSLIYPPCHSQVHSLRPQSVSSQLQQLHQQREVVFHLLWSDVTTLLWCSIKINNKYKYCPTRDQPLTIWVHKKTTSAPSLPIFYSPSFLSSNNIMHYASSTYTDTSTNTLSNDARDVLNRK